MFQREYTFACLQFLSIKIVNLTGLNLVLNKEQWMWNIYIFFQKYTTLFTWSLINGKTIPWSFLTQLVSLTVHLDQQVEDILMIELHRDM